MDFEKVALAPPKWNVDRSRRDRLKSLCAKRYRELMPSQRMNRTHRRSTASLRQPQTMTAANCPGQHGLTEFVTEQRHYCDVCSRSFDAHTTMFGCRLCDYDACVACQPKGGQLPKADTGPANCPGQHGITEFVIEMKHYCDVCSRIFDAGTTMFRCRLCDYDVCVACQPKGVIASTLDELQRACSEVTNAFRDPKSNPTSALRVCKKILENYDSVSGTFGTPPSRSMGHYLQHQFLHEAHDSLLVMHKMCETTKQYLCRKSKITNCLTYLVLTLATGKPESACRYFLPQVTRLRGIRDALKYSQNSIPFHLQCQQYTLHGAILERACAITSDVLLEWADSSFADEAEDALLIHGFVSGHCVPSGILSMIQQYFTVYPDVCARKQICNLLQFYVDPVMQKAMFTHVVQ